MHIVTWVMQTYGTHTQNDDMLFVLFFMVVCVQKYPLKFWKYKH